MFSYRGLFLAVTISLESIVLADILVQPGYEHQYGSDPHYLQYQPVPQYPIQSPAEQYRARQLPNQESTQYLSPVQPEYPNSESYQGSVRSHLVRYPHSQLYHHHHYLPRPSHVHYAKIGSHGYRRPSVFVGYPQPLIVHNRSKRSRRSDPANTESSKPEIVANDNDVAAKPSLTDAKPTAIDSLLPEHEPTDTNDKRVENRQIKNDYITKPHLFGLYSNRFLPSSENMYSGREANRMLDIFQQVMQHTNSHKQMASPASQDTSCDEDQHLTSDRPSIRWEEPSSSETSDDDDYYYRSKYRDAAENEKFWATIFRTIAPSKLSYFKPGWFKFYSQPDNVLNDSEEKEKCERAARQELKKKNLQEITNMDMISMAKPRQNNITIHVPYSEVPKIYHCSETPNMAVTTSVKPYPTYTQNRNNGELSGTNEIVGAPYFDRNGIPLPNYYSYYSDNYPNHYSNHNSDEYSNNANFYIDLNNRNSNSGDSIMPPIRVPDYVLYKNISAPSNPAPMISQAQTQYLDTYNYLPRQKIQAISSDHTYNVNTYPSDTSLDDTFSSPVYY